MKEWMTAREIADAGLPDLPTTKRGVALMASSEGWDENPAYARKREGKGGGFEYHVRLLPTLAQLAFTQRHMVIGAAANDEPAQAAEAAVPLSDRGARERDARLAVVTQFERLCRSLPRLKQASHLQLFMDKYNGGTLAVDAWVKDLVPSVSKRTLLRWLAAKKVGATAALAVDRGQSRKGTGVLDRAEDGRLLDWLLALIAFQPHLAAREVRRQCRHKFGDMISVGGKSVEMPPERTFQHAIKRLKAEKHVLLTKLTNPDVYRQTMKPAGVGTLRHIVEPNALWMIDASPVDALCTDGRHSIYACIDIATRRLVITVSKTPRASAVALMMRKAILAWGAPQQVKTDNGSDFVARDTKRLMDALGIEVLTSDAYSPEQKGHIERAIGTFQHQFAPMLNGYVGASVEDRKAIQSRESFAKRLGQSNDEIFGTSHTAAELQALIDQWLSLDYQHARHGGLKGRTPFEVAAASASPIRSVDERALDLLLMPVAGTNGQRKVTKFGIRIDDFYYSAPDLLPGWQVFVRQDPLDLGRVKVFRADGAEFICNAICPELAGLHPATFHKARRELVAEAMDAAARQVKADMREIGKRPLVEKALEVARRDVPNVVALPKRQVEHSTPEIAAALVAMGAPVPAAPDPATLFQAQLISERVPAAQQLPSNIHPLRSEETNHQRFQRALDIERRLAAGEAVEEREEGWLQGYRTGSEYRAMRMIHDDFGDQVSL